MRFCIVTKDILPGEDEAECLAYTIDDHVDAFDGSIWAAISEDEPDDFDPMAEIARLREAVQLLNDAPINAMAFLVGFAESHMSKTRQSWEVTEWANKVSEKGYGK
jgi:hypothetical protein